MRFLYLDDAGTSRHETHAVVAGVLVHADGQLIPLEMKLQELVNKHIPVEMQDGFAFHMTNIWSGTGAFKDRQTWPIERRVAIMKDLCLVPSDLTLTIVQGCVKKEAQRLAYPGMSASDLDQLHHATAFARCELAAESLMRQRFPTEVLQIVAEDSPIVKKRISDNHALFSDSAALQKIGIDRPDTAYRHVKNDVLFSGKRSRALQVADVCAFFLRAQLAGMKKVDEYYSKLSPMMAFDLYG
ncbi:hypothetical protein LXM94_21865 [Rhizobium sp. TRM95111]|uniref:hypothetical protein n=1 Tax=Rhizobium alarense TaxID=2846851 RepID=UPI001F3E4B2F|nr:hypothetical protein [Rhizobium alarense]MCF3642623.1 hypothetical protein [Rhizobium alarense]